MNSRYCFKQKTYAIIGLFALLFIFTYISTVAYSAINSTLTITGDAVARIEKDIRVSNVKLLSVSGSGMELYSPEHSADTITTGVQLDSLSSKVTYQVTVKNNSNKPMTIGQIKFGTYSNSKMTYDCDFETYTKIDSKSSVTLNITFRYASSVTSLPSDKVLQSTINFIFEEMPKPVLARSDTWYKGSTSRKLITSISFEDNYTVPSGKTVIESWDASEGKKKSVIAYILDDYSLVLSGNGEGNGKVIANTDSSNAFGSNVTTFSFTKVSFLDVSLLDTSNVTNMQYMFRNFGYDIISSFEINGFEKFNVSSVTNMSGMFAYAGYNSSSFILDNIDAWDTSKVTDMSNMFYAGGRNSTTWDIGDLRNWNTSNVATMEKMFGASCYMASTCDIGNLNNWDISNSTNLSNMFYNVGYNATDFNIGDLSGWNVSNVTNMSRMFDSVGKKDTTWSIGKLDNWNTSNVTNMSYMFYGAGSKSTDFSLELSNWDVSKVTDLSSFLANAGESSKSWTVGDLSDWDVSNVTDMSYMFAVTAYSAASWNVGDLGDWDTSNVTNMDSMFFYACNKFSCEQSTFDLSEWDVSSVTNMTDMFMGIKRIDEFNIFNWDVSNVTKLSRMFKQTTFINDSVDFSNWNISNATNIYGVFANLYSEVRSIDISSWNTSKVTDMKEMFYGNTSLETIYVGSGWNTSNVTSSANMFYNTPKLPNYDSNVIDKTNAHGNTGGYMTQLVRFTIDGVKYKALKGMTWTQWIDSEYNTRGDLKDWGYCVGTTDWNYYIVHGSTMIKPTNVISDADYTLQYN